jgi:hypothetical protein
MLISIKHLPKYAVLKALYNNAAKPEEKMHSDEARTIINVLKKNGLQLSFDSLNAEEFIWRTREDTKFPVLLKVDITNDTFDSKEYDALYGKGKAEFIINELRRNVCIQHQLSHHWNRYTVIRDLKVEMQNYNRISELSKTVEEQKAEIRYSYAQLSDEDSHRDNLRLGR